MKKKHIEYDDHHRKSKSAGGQNTSYNISRVKRKYHIAYHLLFGAGDPHFVSRGKFVDMKTKTLEVTICCAICGTHVTRNNKPGELPFHVSLEKAYYVYMNVKDWNALVGFKDWSYYV